MDHVTTPVITTSLAIDMAQALHSPSLRQIIRHCQHMAETLDQEATAAVRPRGEPAELKADAAIYATAAAYLASIVDIIE